MLISPTKMSNRAWTIIGVGIGLLAVCLSLIHLVSRWIIGGGAVLGVLIAIYGLIHDWIKSNKLSLVFSQDPPYIFRDTKYVYQVEFRLGVRGSRRIPQDVKVLVTNIQPTPSSHPYFRADYPYNLPQHGQNGDRELLFQLGTAWINTEGNPIFCGLQMDTMGKPDTLTMKSGEVWDVALQVLSADAKSLEAWMSVAVDVGGKLKVRRYSWKPVSL